MGPDHGSVLTYLLQSLRTEENCRLYADIEEWKQNGKTGESTYFFIRNKIGL